MALRSQLSPGLPFSETLIQLSGTTRKGFQDEYRPASGNLYTKCGISFPVFSAGGREALAQPLIVERLPVEQR